MVFSRLGLLKSGRRREFAFRLPRRSAISSPPWQCAGIAVLVTTTAKIPRPRSYIEVLNKGSKDLGRHGPQADVTAHPLSIAPTSRHRSPHSWGTRAVSHSARKTRHRRAVASTLARALSCSVRSYSGSGVAIRRLPVFIPVQMSPTRRSMRSRLRHV